jgi:hypothetical protein
MLGKPLQIKRQRASCHHLHLTVCLLLLRDQAVTEDSHNAFWNYRLSYFGKMGLLSNRIQWVGKKIRNVLCPKRLQLCGARYLDDHSVKAIQKKLEGEDEDTNTTGGASSLLHKYELLLHGILVFFAKYVICLLLGFVTFGLFWTEDVRKWFFYSASDVHPNDLEMIQKETETLVQSNQNMVQLQTAQSEQMVVLREENMKQSKHIADVNQKLTMIMELLLEEISSSRMIATAVEDSTMPFEETSPSRGNVNSQDSTMGPLGRTSSLGLSATSQESSHSTLSA